jgi:hypothetical protein
VVSVKNVEMWRNGRKFNDVSEEYAAPIFWVVSQAWKESYRDVRGGGRRVRKAAGRTNRHKEMG